MNRIKSWLIFFLVMSCLVGCSGGSSSAKTTTSKKLRDNTPVIHEPVVNGKITLGNDKCIIDLSNQKEGYMMVKYLGSNDKVKFRIYNPGDHDPYTYDVKSGYNVFPITGGSGSYKFILYEHASGTKYYLSYVKTTTLTVKNSYTTYLYPNQFVNFNASSQTVAKGKDLAKNCYSDLDVVSAVYNYIIKHVSYDYDKSKTVDAGGLKGYLPDVDAILKSKKGICFDYAAVMATMLRSQNIPTRMLIGYAKTPDGTVYHAWIGVYIKNKGWIDNLIEFDGKNWSMMDPTIASENPDSSTIKDFITNKNNYVEKYKY